MSIIDLKSCKHTLHLEDADFSASELDEVRFDGTAFRAVSFAGARFERATFAGATLQGVDLSNLAITHGMYDGMTIDGVRVTDALAAYQAREGAK